MRHYYELLWRTRGYPFEKNYFSALQLASITGNLKILKGKILDLGCGDGRVGSLFVEKNLVFGIDFSESAARKARAKGLKTCVGDLAERLPYGDGQFDALLLIEVLEHVFDPVALLREASRVLKKGGILFCTIPNTSTFLNRIYFLLTGDFKDFTAPFNCLYPEFSFTEHIRVLSPRVTERMLSLSGFTIGWAKYWFPPFFERFPFNTVSWLAKIVLFFRLERIFPNAVSVSAFYKCYK